MEESTQISPFSISLCVGAVATCTFFIRCVLLINSGSLLRAALFYWSGIGALWMMSLITAIRFRSKLRLIPRFIMSLMLHSMAPKKHERLVSEFKKLPFTVNSASRSSAMQFLTAVCGACEYEPYIHQMSHDDQVQQFHGTRSYYWAKDLEAAPVMDPVPENPLHIWVDTDYYVSSEDLLDTDAPCALYTLTPAHAAYNDNHFAYTFTDKGDIKVQYKRGQCFQHYLWDFAETFSVTSWYWILPVVRVNYRTFRKPVGPHHSLLLIVPISREYFPLSVWKWLTGDELHGFAAVQNGFSAIRQFGKDGLNVSIARTGSYTDVVLTADQYDGLSSVVATLSSTIRLNAGLVLSHVNTLTHGQAAIVADYFSHAHPTPRDVIAGTGATATYVFDNKPDAYPMTGKLVDICQPLIPGNSYDPASCPANDEACVRERLEKIRSTTEATPRVLQYIQEFVKMMIPKPHTTRMQLVEQVYEQQTRPAQKRLLDEACVTGDQRNQKKVQSFQKAEAYGEPKAPRNISTIRPRPKLWYSAVMYAFVQDHLKKQHWYAFGRACAQVAARIGEICQGAKLHVVDTDYSKFDGTVGPVARRLEEQLLLRAFVESEQEQVLKWHATQYGCVGYTKFGIEYDTGDSRLSGSPETSAFNSCLNAFCAYTAFRMSGLDARTSFDGLGFYGGDDGITADIPPTCLEKAAKELGLTLKANVIKRGERWVSFLARYYSPNVWTGDINSCCDLKRQLSKLHSTVGPCTDPLVKLVQKIAAFSYTDAESPVFSDLVACLERMLGSRENLQDLVTLDSLPYILQDTKDLENSYPNAYNHWMTELLLEQVPDADLTNLREHLRTVTADDLSKLLTLPAICAERPLLIPPNGATEGIPKLTLDQKPKALPQRPPRLDKDKKPVHLSVEQATQLSQKSPPPTIRFRLTWKTEAINYAAIVAKAAASASAPQTEPAHPTAELPQPPAPLKEPAYPNAAVATADTDAKTATTPTDWYGPVPPSGAEASSSSFSTLNARRKRSPQRRRRSG